MLLGEMKGSREVLGNEAYSKLERTVAGGHGSGGEYVDYSSFDGHCRKVEERVAVVLEFANGY